jgi:hypothetical protein
MSAQQYPGEGVKLCKCKDGFWSLFTGANNEDWSLAKAIKVSKERFNRTILPATKGDFVTTTGAGKHITSSVFGIAYLL